MLRDMGIEDERLRLEWISASEGDKVQKVCNEMTEQIRALGPLRLATVPRWSADGDHDRAAELVKQVTS
jgi:F420-non-reducing hydrogenase iron-sulfur subunit